MEKQMLFHVRSCLVMVVTLMTGAFVASALASGNEVKFSLTDNPGRWLDTGTDLAGTRSLAVATPGARVNFAGQSNTVHTRTSLIFPESAARMPFNTPPRQAGDSVTLTTPGLYVFTGSIHS